MAKPRKTGLSESRRDFFKKRPQAAPPKVPRDSVQAPGDGAQDTTASRPVQKLNVSEILFSLRDTREFRPNPPVNKTPCVRVAVHPEHTLWQQFLGASSTGTVHGACADMIEHLHAEGRLADLFTTVTGHPSIRVRLGLEHRLLLLEAAIKSGRGPKTSD